MTIDSFIQSGDLIVAIYTLVSRARQLELGIRIGAWEKIVGIIYLLVIIYLLFYDTFLKLGIAPKWPFEDTLAITPPILSFLITIFFLLFFWWRFQTRTIPRKSIYKFQELAEEFLQREEYSELISLLDRYWESLLEVSVRLSFFTRLRSKFEKLVLLLSPEKDMKIFLEKLNSDKLQVLISELSKINPNAKKKKRTLLKIRELRDVLRKIARVSVQWLMRILPDDRRYLEAAGNLIRVIMSNRLYRK